MSVVRKYLRTLSTDSVVGFAWRGYPGGVQAPSRRSLLLGGAALAAVASVGLRAVVLPQARVGLSLLSDGESQLIEALGEAFFPPGNALGVSAADVDLPALVDALLATELDPQLPTLFRYLLRGLEVGTFAGRGQIFSALSLDERRSVLLNWSDNGVLPRRMAHDAIKSVLGMAFFNAPVVTDRIGWFPRCHTMTAAIPRGEAT